MLLFDLKWLLTNLLTLLTPPIIIESPPSEKSSLLSITHKIVIIFFSSTSIPNLSFCTTHLVGPRKRLKKFLTCTFLVFCCLFDLCSHLSVQSIARIATLGAVRGPKKGAVQHERSLSLFLSSGACGHLVANFGSAFSGAGRSALKPCCVECLSARVSSRALDAPRGASRAVCLRSNLFLFLLLLEVVVSFFFFLSVLPLSFEKFSNLCFPELLCRCLFFFRLSLE